MVLSSKLLLILNPKGMMKTQTFLSGDLVIADYACVKLSSFVVLHVKLWLKEDNILNRFCTFE